MMKYILFTIGSFISVLGLAQNENDEKAKLIKELSDFQECYRYYTTLRRDYSVNFGYLDSSYFKWNPNPNEKFFRLETLLDNLERNNEIDKLEYVKKDFLDYFIQKMYKTYEFEISYKQIVYLQNYKPWNTYPYLILNDSIINISSCEIKRSDHGYIIANKVNTVRNLLDAWSVDESSLIPMSKKYIEKEISYYYYNYQDSSIKPATFDTFISKEIKLKNKISPDIDGLVNSNYYEGASYSGKKVPSIIDLWLKDALERMKNFLPLEWINKVRLIKLNYTIEDERKLWFSSDESDLYISPYLVRAIYIKSYNETPFNLEKMKSRQYTLRDVSDTYKMRKQRFQNNFYFLFLHELAHQKYDGKEKDNLIEELCDCKAVEIIKDQHLPEKLGVFEDILIEVIKEGRTNLWNIENESSILNRLKLIKDVDKNLIRQDCNKFFQIN